MPAPIDPEVRRLRAQIAAKERHHPDNPEAAAPERAALKAVNAAAYVKALVDTFPPLTADQRAKLAVLLLGGEAR
jgi:hypothetical protein